MKVKVLFLEDMSCSFLFTVFCTKTIPMEVTLLMVICDIKFIQKTFLERYP